jgi:predicted histidine transporter YuiF (NhaC family)
MTSIRVANVKTSRFIFVVVSLLYYVDSTHTRARHNPKSDVFLPSSFKAEHKHSATKNQETVVVNKIAFVAALQSNIINMLMTMGAMLKFIQVNISPNIKKESRHPIYYCRKQHQEAYSYRDLV